MPRRRQGRNRRAQPFWRYMVNTAEWDVLRGDVLATGAGAGATNMGTIVHHQPYTLSTTTRMGHVNLSRQDDIQAGVVRIRDRERPRRGEMPEPVILDTDVGRIVLSLIAPTAATSRGRRELRQFLSAHHGGFYPPDVEVHINPENSTRAGAERYFRAQREGDIDHDRETKQLSVVAAGMIMPGAAPHLFLLAVDPGFRRLGIASTMFGLMGWGGLTPTCWVPHGLPLAVREAAQGFLTTMGQHPVEQGRNGDRWGQRRSARVWT